MQVNKRYTLYFNPEITKEPIVCDIIKKYNIEINIIRAEIKSDSEGYTVLDMSAEESIITKACEYLSKRGVKLVPAKSQVLIDYDKCINCGACTGVCFSGALNIQKPNWILSFSPDKCISCGLCFTSCPLQLIKPGSVRL